MSVRLSAAFVAPPVAASTSMAPSVPGSRSASHSRAPTEVGDYEDMMHTASGRVSRAGSHYGIGNGDGVDVLREGDIIGQGCLLRGKIVKAVPPSLSASSTSANTPTSAFPGASAIAAGTRFEVVRSLGTGSYAVVYLVREILAPPVAPPTPARSYLGLGLGGLHPLTSANGDIFDDEDVFGFHQSSSPLAFRSSSQRSTGVRRSSLLKPIDERSNLSSSPLSPLSPSSPADVPEQPKYGREFAIKVLSKSSLDRDELAVQMTEVTIHQSLEKHDNIVTLYGAMETDELLMLVLEYVRGEDLYYFLEQQQQLGSQDVDGDEGEGDRVPSSAVSSRRSSLYSSSSYSYSGASSMGSDMDELELELEPSRGRTRRTRHHHHHSHQPHNPHPQSDEKAAAAAGTTTTVSGTPPTPSLLSNVHPAHMLSYGRLKLIASMFAQMCDAVEVRFFSHFLSASKNQAVDQSNKLTKLNFVVSNRPVMPKGYRIVTSSRRTLSSRLTRKIRK